MPERSFQKFLDVISLKISKQLIPYIKKYGPEEAIHNVLYKIFDAINDDWMADAYNTIHCLLRHKLYNCVEYQQIKMKVLHHGFNNFDSEQYDIMIKMIYKALYDEALISEIAGF